MNEQEQNIVNNIKKSTPFEWVLAQFKKIDGKVLFQVTVITLPILIGCLIYFTGLKTSDEIKTALKDNKEIEKKIDSLKAYNTFLIDRMYELEKKQTLFFAQISENNNLIKENNKELVKLKKIYNEKINSINGYNISQLDSFFTSRYKEYYNK